MYQSLWEALPRSLRDARSGLKLAAISRREVAGKYISFLSSAGSLRAIGFGLLDISGLRYNPLSKKATISSDTSVNYLMCAEKAID